LCLIPVFLIIMLIWREEIICRVKKFWIWFLRINLYLGIFKQCY
jgi:hypothetical protein